MIQAPASVQAKLASGNFRSANIITVNLGDAYDSGSDLILYLTDCPYEFDFEGHTWTPDHAMNKLEGISRKASRGSDKISISFSVVDPVVVAAIRSERYINKPIIIRRVVFDDDGTVLDNFAIPVRTAWGISHEVSGNLEKRTVKLTADSILGDLNDDNGWYCVNSSHWQRYENDWIMRHIGTVLDEDDAKRYTTNYRGVIDKENKPPAVPIVYGQCEVKPIPIMMLKHRKSHSTYRHYFTTFIYVVSAGTVNNIKTNSIRKGDDIFEYNYVNDNNFEYGGWSIRIKTPDENNVPIETDPKLNFWRQRLDFIETQRLAGMYGKGLTLMFVINRNRDDWIQSPPEFTLPVGGISCFDPRTGSLTPDATRNPALQYYDFLTNSDYGAANRGVTVSQQSIIDLADHFDNLPGSFGNPGINDIKIDVVVDSSEPLVDNMNIWMETCRMFTSDYYGEFVVRVETIGNSVWDIQEGELLGYPTYESGDFTDRLNKLTYTIRQEVDDPSPDAPPGATMFVDVEATFPDLGSQIHDDWLAEDGGIPNFDSSKLDNVTILEQAYYWAMVDSRISRQPRKLSLELGEKAWLLEVGDIITYTSPIDGETNTEWRVHEVTEDEDDETGGVVEVECVAYSNAFYSPDPNVIPDPVAPAQPPPKDSLSNITGFGLIFEDGLNKITWDPLSSSDVAWYAVEILMGATVPNGAAEIARVVLYKRSTSVPTKPDDDSAVYDFDLDQLTTVPSGWFVTEPAGNDPLYTTYATFVSVTGTGIVNEQVWSDPIIFDPNDDTLFIVYSNPKVINPPLALPPLPAGNYQANITAFRVGDEGNVNQFGFTLTNPEQPTLNITASNFELFIIPVIGNPTPETQFELYINTVDDFINAIRVGLSSGSFSITGRLPNTTYHLWCRTVLPSGVSTYTYTTVTTTNDGSIFNNLLGFDVSDGKSVYSATIYKRSPNALPTPVGGGFNFDSFVLTPPVGWSATVPAGNDPLYVSTGIAWITGTSGEDTDIPWSAAEILVQNGDSATSGTSIYQAALYQRSATPPATPAPDSATYNFGTNEFDVLPSGWTETVEAGSDPVYVTYATFSIVGNTGTDSTQTWTSPVVFVENGEPGDNGVSIYTFNLYLRSATAPLPATGGEYDFGTNTVTPPAGGWQTSIPAGDDPIYIISTTASISGDTGVDDSLTWTPPVVFVKNGADGVDGDDGKSVASLTIYKRGTVQPATPTGGGYDFTNDILTPPLTWSAVLPSGTDPIYASTALASIVGNEGSDNSIPWSQPELLAENGQAGKSVYQAALFRRSATPPTKPANDSATFSFTTNTFTVLPSGWTDTVPAGDDPVYVTYATFTISGDIGEDGTQTWTNPVIFAENGEGAISTYTFNVYQRSDVQPATPTGGEYDFGTNAITAPAGWFIDIVEGDDPLYVSTTTASTTGATGVDNTLSWSTPKKFAENGQEGITVAVAAPKGTVYRENGGSWLPSTTITQSVTFYRAGAVIAVRSYEFQRVDGDGTINVVLASTSGEATTGTDIVTGAISTSVVVTHVNSGASITIECESILDGSRGSGSYSRDISPAVAWSDSEADLATPGDNVIADQVTLYNESAGYVETRFWDGFNWLTAAAVWNGNQLFPGSVTAAKINVDDLFAKDITATGVIRYTNGGNFAELGGGNLINTRGTSGTIFRVTPAGGGILDGGIILSGSVPEGALSAAEVNRLKDLINPFDAGTGGTQTGGTLSNSFNFSGDSGSTLSGLNHGSNNVTVRFSGDTSWPTGADPGIPSATLTFQRRSNAGTWTTINTTTVNATVEYDSLGFWFVSWVADITFVDSTAPSSTTLDYRVDVDVNNTFQNSVNAHFSVEEPLTQTGGGSTDWASITNKPSPTITLTGDVTGSGTMTELGSVSISCTVSGGTGVDDDWTTLGTPPATTIAGLDADKLDGNHASAFTKTTDNIAWSRITGAPAFLTSVSWSQVTGKPTFATVATSGDYNDLINKPSSVDAVLNDTGNKIRVGWNGSRVYFQVDSTQFNGSQPIDLNMNYAIAGTLSVNRGGTGTTTSTGTGSTVRNGSPTFTGTANFAAISASGLIAGGTVRQTSDRRVKSDLKVIENALDKVCQLTGYTYFRDDIGSLSAGIIAQDQQKVLPESVGVNSATGLLQVDTQGQVALIVEAIKEIRDEIERIKGQL